MKLRQFITAMSIALLPLAASAATFIVPAAGTGPGANDSHWQSELTLHSTAATPITLGLTFHDASGTAQQGQSVTVNPRSTVAIADIVKSVFGRDSATGAIEITVPDSLSNRIALTSRTFNASAIGQFGQDIPVINANDAATAGEVLVLQAPSSATDARFNFGLYAVADATVRWDLVRADGTVVSPLAQQNYSAGTQIQYNQGIQNFLGTTEQDNDTLQAVISSGKVIAYGSAINNQSGDPSFVPGVRTRADIRLNFVGVDVNGNGTIDATDADHDGVLDKPIDLYLLGYPNWFKIVVTGPNGEPATLAFIDAPDDAHFVNADTVQWYPNPVEGPTLTLKVRATVGDISEVLTIPVKLH